MYVDVNRMCGCCAHCQGDPLEIPLLAGSCQQEGAGKPLSLEWQPGQGTDHMNRGAVDKIQAVYI